MEIRMAKLNDEKEVLSLLDELIACVNKLSKYPPKFSESDEVRGKIFQDLLKRDDVKTFVVEDGGKVVAMADVFILPVMRRGANHAHVEDFVVSQNLRGKGIGTKLMEYIKDYCWKNNIKIIKLASGLEIEDAHKFYEKNGGKFTEKMFRFEPS